MRVTDGGKQDGGEGLESDRFFKRSVCKHSIGYLVVTVSRRCVRTLPFKNVHSN